MSDIILSETRRRPKLGEYCRQPVNSLFLGVAGSGKSSRILQEINRLKDFPEQKVFILGKLPGNPALKFSEVRYHATKTFRPQFDCYFNSTFDRLMENASDEFKPLIILDEGGRTPKSIQTRVEQLLRADKITLWTAFQSPQDILNHWNLSLLKYFRDFYFFSAHESSRAFFKDVQLFDSLLWNGIAAPVYLADKTATDFFAVETLNFTNDGH